MLLSEYNQDWINQFEAIRETLLQALAGLCINIEHVGSTAIPGLAAKPIIDIDIVYNETPHFEKIKNNLVSVGYFHNGNQNVEGREVFKRTGNKEDKVLDAITHHLYVCRYDCPELHRHILFRNYLRKHNLAKTFYMNMKYEIAKEVNNDRKLYANIKELKGNSFINYIVELSRMEHGPFGKVKC
jgi:GrpB-like predicted nucleotidyltransferase (UPF0157 family)